MEATKRPKIENLGEITEFVELVRQMRYNQRRYFNTRNPDVLKISKELERKVDSLIARAYDTQTSLF